MDLSRISQLTEDKQRQQYGQLNNIIDYLKAQTKNGSQTDESKNKIMVGLLEELIEYERQRNLFLNGLNLPKNQVIAQKSKITQTQFKKSEPLYSKLCRQKKINSPTTFFYLGELFKILQNQMRAEQCYRQSIELDSNFIQGYHGLGLLLKQQQKYEKAEIFLLRVLDLRPLSKSGHYNLGLLYQKMKKYDQSFQYFCKTIQIDPKLIDAYEGAAYTLFQQKKYKQAKQYIQNGLKINPKSQICQKLLGDIQKLQEKKQKIKQKQEEKRPTSGKQPNKQEIQQNEVLNDLFLQQMLLKFLGQGNKNIEGQSFQQIILIADIFVLEGKFDQAEKQYQKAIEINPNQYTAYSKLSSLLLKEQRFQQAEKNLQIALRLNPQFQGAMNILSKLYVIFGKKLNQAEELLKKILKNKPDSIEDQCMLGQCYTKMKKFNEAKLIYQKLQPNSIKRLLGLAEVFQAENKKKQAQEFYQKARSVEPNNLDVLKKLHQFQFQKHNFSKCQQILKKLIQLQPNCSNTYYTLGLVQGRLQKYQIAYNYSGKAIQFEPDNPLYLVKHAQILFKLKRMKDALESLKKAKVILSINNPANLMQKHSLSIGNIFYMIQILSLLQQIQKISKQQQKLNSEQKQRFSSLTTQYFQSIISQNKEKKDIQLNTLRTSFISIRSQIVQDDFPEVQQQKQQKKQIKMLKPHIIPLKVISAALNQSKSLIGKMDPYCKITYGANTFATNVQKNGDLNPVWSKQFSLKRQQKPTMIIFQVYEKSLIRSDKLLGEAKIMDNENNLRNAKNLQLKLQGQKSGELTVRFY